MAGPPINVEEVIQRYGIPEGYRRLYWRQATPGQLVWVYGVEPAGRGRIALAYGPHSVRSVTERQLINRNLRLFYEPQETLLIRET